MRSCAKDYLEQIQLVIRARRELRISRLPIRRTNHSATLSPLRFLETRQDFKKFAKFVELWSLSAKIQPGRKSHTNAKRSNCSPCHQKRTVSSSDWLKLDHIQCDWLISLVSLSKRSGTYEIWIEFYARNNITTKRFDIFKC